MMSDCNTEPVVQLVIFKNTVMSKIQIPANLLTPGGGFGIVRSSGKTYVVPAWQLVPDDTTIDDIQVIGRNDIAPIHQPKTIQIAGSKGNAYTVSFNQFGQPSCSCVGFSYHKKCKHIAQALAM